MTIRSLYPDAQICFLSSDPREAARHFSKFNVESHGRLLNTHGRTYKGSKKILYLADLVFRAFLLLINTKVPFPISKKDKFTLDLFRNSDVVIIGGGGMFGGNKYRSISGNLFPLYLARKLGKKIVVYSPSVEPFTSEIVRFATKLAFDKADVITVREKYTFDLLRDDLHVAKPIYLTADPAFLIDHEPLETGFSLLRDAGVPNNKKFRIGMAIRDWHFPGEKDSYLKQTRYQDVIRSSIERILTEMDAIIVLFATSINLPYDDDRVISLKLRESIREEVRDRVFVLTEDYSPQEIKAMMGTMDIFVATRTHSSIFALSMNIPLLNIACEPNKNHGIIESLGLEEYVLDASAITTDSLVADTYRLMRERDSIAKRIRDIMPIIKSKAMANGKIVQALLDATDRDNMIIGVQTGQNM